MKKFKNIIMVILFLIMTMSLTGCNDTEEDNEAARKEIQCNKQSDTYNKCSYSFREERCVCKQR